jgi:hypothetical protein
VEIVQLPQAPFKVPRDGRGRPLIVPKTGGKPVAHTRTTTFIDCIDDKSNLNTWDKRMVLIGAAMKPELLDGVLDLDRDDPEDKRTLNAIAERVKDASGANDKREQGTHLHALTEAVDAGVALPESTPAADVADMASYMVETLDFTVLHVERLVVVSSLMVAGTPDRISYYEGPGPTGRPVKGNYITDLKTGSVEYGALKMAMQLGIYSRGELYNHSLFPVDVDDKKAFIAWKKTEFPAELAVTAYTPQGGRINQRWGIIMNLPAGSGACALYWVDLAIGWRLAKLALRIRAARATKKAMLPFFVA